MFTTVLLVNIPSSYIDTKRENRFFPCDERELWDLTSYKIFFFFFFFFFLFFLGFFVLVLGVPGLSGCQRGC